MNSAIALYRSHGISQCANAWDSVELGIGIISDECEPPLSACTHVPKSATAQRCGGPLI